MVLVGLVALAATIPGYSILSGSDWHPPGVGGAAFRVSAAVLAAGVMALMFLARRRIQVLRARLAMAFFGGTLLLGLGMMFTYRASLDVRVVPYVWDGVEYPELIPFGTSRWVNAELMRRIRSANDPDPRSAAAVRPSHLARTIERYGPSRVQRFYGGWQTATVAGLWLGYVGTLALFAAAFGMAAVRLGPEWALEKEKKEGEKRKDGEEARPESAAAAPASAAPAADVSPERRTAALEAELRQVRARLEQANETGPSRNGWPGSPLVVRAEIRASGWLLLGAAAMVWWISREEREQRRARPAER